MTKEDLECIYEECTTEINAYVEGEPAAITVGSHTLRDTLLNGSGDPAGDMEEYYDNRVSYYVPDDVIELSEESIADYIGTHIDCGVTAEPGECEDTEVSDFIARLNDEDIASMDEETRKQALADLGSLRSYVAKDPEGKVLGTFYSEREAAECTALRASVTMADAKKALRSLLATGEHLGWAIEKGAAADTHEALKELRERLAR